MPLTVGLDFGTAKCVVTRVNRRTGQPEPLDIDGSASGIVPSALLYQDGSNRPLVGVRAENTDPARAIYSVKPFLGRDLDAMAGAAADALRAIQAERGLSPEQVAGDLFRFLRDKTIEELGELPSAAVLTVPVYANRAAREATRRAAESAGWKVSQLLAEPVAAGVAYLTMGGLDASRNQRLVVYDLGGGTFDFAAMDYAPPATFRVYAKLGDPSLGGDKLDEVIFQRAMEPGLAPQLDRARSRGATDLLDLKRMALIKAQATKHALSDDDVAPLLFAPGGDEPLVHLPSLQRHQFNEWISPIVAASLERVDRELARLGWRAEDTTAVILAGGGARVPLVRALLEARFGKAKVFSSPRLDMMVAFGAALVADEQVTPKVEEVLGRSVSVRVPGTGDQCRFLMRRGLPLCEARRTFQCIWQSGGGTSIALDLCAGESERWSENEFLCRVVLTSPSALRQGTRVAVSVGLSEGGDAVDVSAKVEESDQPIRATTELQPSQGTLPTGSVRLDDRPAADIALLVDGTGSMRYRGRSLVPEVAAAAELLSIPLQKAGVDASYAVISFGAPSNGSCVQSLPFGAGPDMLARRLRGLREWESGPEPEPTFRAIREALPCLATARPEAAKWLVLVTDAPAIAFDAEVLNWLTSWGYRAVVVGPQGRLYDESYDRLAVVTGGKYFDISRELSSAFAWVAAKVTGKEGVQ